MDSLISHLINIRARRTHTNNTIFMSINLPICTMLSNCWSTQLGGAWVHLSAWHYMDNWKGWIACWLPTKCSSPRPAHWDFWKVLGFQIFSWHSEQNSVYKCGDINHAGPLWCHFKESESSNEPLGENPFATLCLYACLLLIPLSAKWSQGYMQFRAAFISIGWTHWQ